MSLSEQISTAWPKAKLKVTGPDRDKLHIVDVTYMGARIIIGWYDPIDGYRVTTATQGIGPEDALHGTSGIECDNEDEVMHELERLFGAVQTARKDGLLKATAQLLRKDNDGNPDQ